MTLKDLIKDNIVTFSFYRNGNMFYLLHAKELYQFPIPLEDIGNATLSHEMRAITVMRYIRKAVEDKTILRKYITSSVDHDLHR